MRLKNGNDYLSVMIIKKMKKILVALIHNNEKERVFYMREELKKLSDYLNKNYQHEYNEYSFQPEKKEIDFLIALQKTIDLWKLNRDWNEYKGKKNKNIVLDSINLIHKITKLIFIFLKKKYFHLAIDLYVTNKHINALCDFIESHNDFLIVLEDDVVFKEGAFEKIFFIFEKHKDESLPFYITLGGGVNQEELGYKDFIIKKEEGFEIYKKILGNTACAYVINKKQAQIFMSYVIKNPKTRYLPIDWLYNKIFIWQFKNLPNFFCAQAIPNIIHEGSATGERKSWRVSQ